MRVLGFVIVLLAWTLVAQVAWAEEGRWQALENNPACVVWNPNPQEQETVTWSGACANGKAQGHGTAVWRYVEDGDWKEIRYEGDYKDGKRDGHGVLVWTDGTRYEGDWKDGKQHGRGLWVGVNGDRYEGDYRNDKKHGRGTYYFANGDKCEGDWRENRLVGRGKGRSEGRWMKCYQGDGGIEFAD